MLDNILNTHIMDARPIENFLQAPGLREAIQIHNISKFLDVKSVTPRGSGACEKFYCKSGIHDMGI